TNNAWGERSTTSRYATVLRVVTCAAAGCNRTSARTPRLRRGVRLLVGRCRGARLLGKHDATVDFALEYLPGVHEYLALGRGRRGASRTSAWMLSTHRSSCCAARSSAACR